MKSNESVVQDFTFSRILVGCQHLSYIWLSGSALRDTITLKQNVCSLIHFLAITAFTLHVFFSGFCFVPLSFISVEPRSLRRSLPAGVCPDRTRHLALLSPPLLRHRRSPHLPHSRIWVTHDIIPSCRSVTVHCNCHTHIPLLSTIAMIAAIGKASRNSNCIRDAPRRQPSPSSALHTSEAAHTRCQQRQQRRRNLSLFLHLAVRSRKFAALLLSRALFAPLWQSHKNNIRAEIKGEKCKILSDNFMTRHYRYAYEIYKYIIYTYIYFNINWLVKLHWGALSQAAALSGDCIFIIPKVSM